MISLLFFQIFFVLALVESKEHNSAHLGDQLIKHSGQRGNRTAQLRKYISPANSSSLHNERAPPIEHLPDALLPRFLVLMESSNGHINWNVICHIIFSILTLVGSFTLFILSMWQASKLFSKGICSQKFLKGGGYWVIGAATIGFAIGIAVGMLVYPYFLCYFISGFMLIGASVVYIGRRGAIVGTTGGMTAGLALAIVQADSVSASILTGLLFTVGGLVIGFVPIFPNLKMNSRYIQQGLRSSTLLVQQDP